ncbi:LytTR family DNA-binding domain-containing protein [Maricaulis sp.]|uniref:LytTR family DNA-binding domain-containing protein n=1 Tax=unclassified Maricaulis TaxID=2632371 RepID=UPI001B1D0641|nr:LytTR family DNA-binding domain-containing protein [Maricaulis sp.]MBO6795672.1 LytTR family transcriptional regulator [Maricaulis sp.]
MENREYNLEQDAERRLRLTAMIAVFSLTLIMMTLNASSLLMEASRDGREINPLFPWLSEGTSAFYILVLFFGLLWLERRFPIERGTWRRNLVVHAGAALVWSSLHILAMGLTREAIYPALLGWDYRFFSYPGPFEVFLYELRKDLVTYTLQLMTLTALRTIEWHRMEAAAARRDARETQRLTLKCGGRIMHLEAMNFLTAKAAGNYVEIEFQTGSHLARITLAELQNQLVEARVDAVRCHRSWLVNRAQIREIRPTGEGDVEITLDSGRQVPGSRRYRDQLKRAN